MLCICRTQISTKNNSKQNGSIKKSLFFLICFISTTTTTLLIKNNNNNTNNNNRKMASSNRHWPSMFKSKPCNTHHQWQHDINHSLSCHRTSPYSSVGGCEERSPEPKPRWNPKPEQIRILEAIFNSGMVNPPRDEIRKIRAQLQEFGQVGDANVFYWFQNRKSRSKHKLRHHLHASKHQTNPSPPPPPKPASEGSSAAAPSSSSSSSDKSTNMIGFGGESANNAETLIRHSPGGSVNQQSFVGGGGVQDHHQYPIFFPSFEGQSSTFTHPNQGLSFPHHDIMVQSNSDDHSLDINNGPCTNLLLSEIMSHHHRHHHHGSPKDVNHGQNSQLTAAATTTSATTVTTSSIPPVVISSGITCADVSVPPISPVISHILGGEAKTTVFINDVAFEVPVGPFNVREAFGEEAVLINSYGHPVLTNQWGLTLHSLHHGAFYYLI